jgi:type VI secretion system VgrG family protein
MKDFVAVRIESAAFGTDAVHVAELSGREAVSRLFEFELRLASQGDIDEEALLTKGATLIFERKSDGADVKELRRVSGMVRSVRDRGMSEANHHEYVAVLVPRAWQATLTSTSDVCMDMSVPDILKKKLQEGAALDPGKDLDLRLDQSYPAREFVVQYKETNFAFCCRLAEDLGIHFSFEQKDGKDVMVFADGNASLKPAEPAKAPFAPRGDRSDVYELESRRQLVSKSFVARDYNYRNPGMDVLGQAQTTVLGSGKVDEYGPHAKTPDEATFYARVRAEEASSQHLVFEGKSDLPGARAGSLLTVEGHPRGDLELLVTEVTHELTQAVFGVPPAKERPYRNEFRAILRDVPFRPARVTPKPVVHGVVTGIVESAAATDFGAIDDQGRYRVTFMYDSVTGRGDGKASRPLRMAQPSASAGRGFHAPLKPGTEVIVTCVNGDPDRPIIAGAVPNPQTPSPVSSANAEKSMWTTNKNSIAIDDDKPRCKVSVAGEDHVLQIGHPNGPELGILMETKENISERTKKVKTSYSKLETMLTERKFGTATDDILQAAGIPNPMSAWDKVQEAAQAFSELAKSVSAMADGVADMFEYGEQDAKEAKEEADAELKKVRKKAFEKLGQGKSIDQFGMQIVDSPKPKVVSNPDGTARYETQDEAEQRTFDEALKDPKNKKTADEIDAAMKKSADAQKNLEEVQKHTAEAATKEATDDVQEFLQDVEDVGEKIGEYKDKAEKLYEKYEKYADAVKAKIEKIKGVGPALKKLAEKGAPLISKISSIFQKATQKALDEVVKDAQKAGNAVPSTSGERNGHDVGSFASPHNIQLSRNSAALFGGRNAFMFGAKNATILSAASSSILARGRVDVKSTKLVEVAAKKIALSAKKEIDAYSDGTVLVVAKSQGVKVPSEASIVVNGQQDVHVVSDDKSLHVKANKNISVFANEGNLVMTSKKGDFLWLAEEGKLELEVKKGTAKVAVKGKTELATEDELHVTAKKTGTVKTDDALTLDCKDGHWKASGDVDVQAGGNVKVKATTIKISGKVELG